MADHEEFANRLTAVESGVAAAQADASAARHLAAGASADVAEVRAALTAHFRVLNALRETQREGFARMDRRFAEVDRRFAEVDRRLAEVDQNFAKVDQNFAKVDQNFAKVDQNFAKVDQNFAKVDQNFATVERQFAVVNAGIAQITTMLTTLIDAGSGQAGQN
jgi:chromosome segregation ATPase